jgi:hypothetical protein
MYSDNLSFRSHVNRKSSPNSLLSPGGNAAKIPDKKLWGVYKMFHLKFLFVESFLFG